MNAVLIIRAEESRMVIPGDIEHHAQRVAEAWESV